LIQNWIENIHINPRQELKGVLQRTSGVLDKVTEKSQSETLMKGKYSNCGRGTQPKLLTITGYVGIGPHVAWFTLMYGKQTVVC